MFGVLIKLAKKLVSISHLIEFTTGKKSHLITKPDAEGGLEHWVTLPTSPLLELSGDACCGHSERASLVIVLSEPLHLALL